MLDAVRFYHFNVSIITLDRESHLINGVAFLDLFQNAPFPFGEFGGLFKTSFDGAEKTVILFRHVSLIFCYSNRLFNRQSAIGKEFTIWCCLAYCSFPIAYCLLPIVSLFSFKFTNFSVHSYNI